MSQANIPNVTPNITVTKEESIRLLLSSVAMNELAFSHLLNAEAEKLQAFVAYTRESECIQINDFLEMNKSITHFIEDIAMGQWLSLKKLDRSISLLSKESLDDLLSE